MKIELANETRRRSLGDLNVGSFFCKCQMTQADVPHICTAAEPVKPSMLERVFPDRYFSTQVIVAAIVVIGIIVFAFNSWS